MIEKQTAVLFVEISNVFYHSLLEGSEKAAE